MISRISRSDAADLALIAVGTLVRLRQFAAGRSLWLDEAFVAVNLVGRSYGGLMGKLEHNQAAPAGFLFLEKALGAATGYSELALRLPSLLAGIATLFLFRALAKKFLGPREATLALALIALSPELVRYSDELKQYSSDVAACLVVTLAFLRLDPAGARPRQAAWVGLVGASAVWLSYPSAFVLGSAGLIWLADLRSGRARLKVVAPIVAAWSISLVAAYLLVIRAQSDDAFLARFWKSAFLPLRPRSLTDLTWLPRNLVRMFAEPGGLFFPEIGLMTAFVGATSLARGRPRAAAILLLPVSLTLAASSLGKYPFADRLILFFAPAMAILIGRGVGAIVGVLPGHRRAVGVGLVLALVASQAARMPVLLARARRQADVREVMEHLRDHRRPGDRVYLYFRFVPAWTFYSARLGLAGQPVVIGETPAPGPILEQIARCERDLGAIGEGGRAWLLFTHTFITVEETFESGRYLVERLSASRRRIETPAFQGAEIFLFDPDRPRPSP